MARFGLFLAAAFLMTGRGYSLPDLLSTKLVDSTGPFSCLISILIFVGARRRNWIILGRTIVCTSILFSALVLVSIARLGGVSRPEAAVSLGGLLGVLYWTGAWVALKEYPPSSWIGHLRFVPIGIFALGSIFTETRMNFVLLIALLVVHAYVQRRRGIPQASMWALTLGLGAWAGLFIATYLQDTHAFRSVGEALTAFASRLDDDTRTGQFVSFAATVHPSELLLGRGSLATWDWNGMPYRGGTDLGYLTLLFYGGVPLLLTYFAVHIAPCFTVLKGRAAGLRLTAAGVVLLWVIAMLCSAYPDMSPAYYPILLCVGACISREGSCHAQEPTV